MIFYSSIFVTSTAAILCRSGILINKVEEQQTSLPVCIWHS